MGYEPQADFGTPASNSEKLISLTIDGRAVTVPEGTSVMRAAAESGGSIPKLCATDNVKSFGSCRLCLVEVDGMRGTPASCTTPVMEGMNVHTQTPRLQKLRKGVMELYISDHPLDCLTCSDNNDCELQDNAAAVGLRDVRYGYSGDNHLGLATDTSNPYFDFDPSKCAASPPRSRPAPAWTTSSRPNASRAVPACRPARPRRCRKSR
jgi:formate dehydrogenase major subunit